MEQHIPMTEIFSEDTRDRRRSKEEREELLLHYRAILGSEAGKNILFDIINQTGVFLSSFTGNSTTFYLEGKREIGLYLYRQLMDADPLALQMLIDFKRNSLKKGEKNND